MLVRFYFANSCIIGQVIVIFYFCWFFIVLSTCTNSYIYIVFDFVLMLILLMFYVCKYFTIYFIMLVYFNISYILLHIL